MSTNDQSIPAGNVLYIVRVSVSLGTWLTAKFGSHYLLAHA